MSPSKAEPERRCIVTGDSGSPSGMVRFVISPGGVVTPDLDGKLPGRGIWVTATLPALKEAISRRLFSKAAKEQVTTPDDLLERVEAGLGRKCLDLLSLARRAGQCVNGFEKVERILRAGKAGVYVCASAEGADARRKLEALTRGSIPIVTAWDAQTLSSALGRQNAVHVVVLPGGLCETFLEAYARYAGVRGTDDGHERHG